MLLYESTKRTGLVHKFSTFVLYAEQMAFSPLRTSLAESTAVTDVPPQSTPWWRGILDNRLVHFFLIGAALFAFSPRQSTQTVLRTEQVEAWVKANQRKAGKALASKERAQIVHELLEDELLYREGLRLGLDKDDPVVRGRIIQKMIFLAEDTEGTAKPITDDEVRTWYNNHQENYVAPSLFSFEQLYFSKSKRGDDSYSQSLALAEQLRVTNPQLLPNLGDGLPSGRQVHKKTERDISNSFGEGVASAVASLSVGQWSRAIESSLGWHIVRVTAVDTGRTVSFDEAKKDIVATIRLERKRAALDRLVTRLMASGQVVLENPEQVGPLPQQASERLFRREGGE